MTVSVQLSNLGPLRSAELEVADLNLLIGENNTGKTFLATVLHRVLGTSPSSSPFWRHGREEEIPDEVEQWISKALDTLDDDMDSEFDLVPSTSTMLWAKNLTTETLDSYGTNVRDSIAYAFGAEPSLLRRRTRTRHAADCYLRIANSKPQWQIEVRFDSEKVNVHPPDPAEWLKLVLRPDHIRKSLRRFRPSRATTRQFGDLLGFFPGRFSSSTTSGVFTSWPSNAIHLNNAEP